MQINLPNVDWVIANLEAIVDGFSFTRTGRDQSLGRDIANTIIRGPDIGGFGGIMGRAADGKGPDGQPWPENSDNPSGQGYASQKQRKYGWSETNRRTGQMLSQQSLMGRTTIEPKLITMRYGTDDPPSDSRAPTGYISDQDEAISDTKKAEYAHDHQRGFYGFSPEDRTNVIAVAQESMDDYIRTTNQANQAG